MAPIEYSYTILEFLAPNPDQNPKPPRYELNTKLMTDMHEMSYPEEYKKENERKGGKNRNNNNNNPSQPNSGIT